MISQTQRFRNAVVAAILGFAAILQITPLWAQSSGSAEHCRELVGTIGEGQGPGWGSGWIDLTPVQDFRKGDRLRIKVGRDAKKVFVQLLRNGTPPGSPIGIIGSAVKVPASREIDVRIPGSRHDIWQIAVHGGPRPFKMPIHPDNPPATLVSVCLLR